MTFVEKILIVTRMFSCRANIVLACLPHISYKMLYTVASKRYFQDFLDAELKF